VNLKVLVLGVVMTGGLVAILASGFGNDPHATPDVMTAEPAPDFSLTTLDTGHVISLASLAGTPVVINFWSTWCQPCKIEHPYLLDAARRYKGQGVVFLGVLYGDEPSAARRFTEANGSAFPTVLDAGGRMATDYGVTGVPETFVIDAQGQIVERVVGPVGPDTLTDVLEELL